MSVDVVLVKPKEAARRLAISERHLWDITNESKGGLPCVRIGRSVRYDPADLAKWVEQCKGTVQKNQKENAPW